MGKGLKIGRARLIDSGKLINASEYNLSDKENIECEFCKTKLKHTKAHWRIKAKDNRIWISSYFSLNRFKEHEKYCRYNIINAVEILVRDSYSVENLDEQTLFKNNLSFEFRLHILDKLIKAVKNDNSINDQVESYSNATIPKTIKGRLSPYLKTAKELAKLWSLIESSDDKKTLQNKVSLIYEGRKIAWSDFVFETNRLHKLVSKKCNHPVAVLLVLKGNIDSDDTRKNKYSIQAYSDIQTDVITVPRIFFNDELILHEIKPNYQYLVIGNFICQKGKGLYNNINLFINDKSQIIRLGDDIVPDPDK